MQLSKHTLSLSANLLKMKFKIFKSKRKGADRLGLQVHVHCLFTLYLIGKPDLNTLENRTDPDQAALVGAA